MFNTTQTCTIMIPKDQTENERLFEHNTKKVFENVRARVRNSCQTAEYIRSLRQNVFNVHKGVLPQELG